MGEGKVRRVIASVTLLEVFRISSVAYAVVFAIVRSCSFFDVEAETLSP